MGKATLADNIYWFFKRLFCKHFFLTEEPNAEHAVYGQCKVYNCANCGKSIVAVLTGWRE